MKAYTRGGWEQNSRQDKLQLIIIVIDNKDCNKTIEAMLTAFIIATKAKEITSLSPSYLLEGCHLGRKEASGKPAGRKRKETSQTHTEELPSADFVRSCSQQGESLQL